MRESPLIWKAFHKLSYCHASQEVHFAIQTITIVNCHGSTKLSPFTYYSNLCTVCIECSEITYFTLSLDLWESKRFNDHFNWIIILKTIKRSLRYYISFNFTNTNFIAINTLLTDVTFSTLQINRLNNCEQK